MGHRCLGSGLFGALEVCTIWRHMAPQKCFMVDHGAEVLDNSPKTEYGAMKRHKLS
jgi:hypothetical protein